MTERDDALDIEINGSEMKVSHRLSARQKQMLEALRLTGCNVSAAAEKCGVGRSTHYAWIEKNEKYREAIKDLDERLIDNVESKLMANIGAGNQKAIEYFLDSKAKERGYGQTKRLEVGGMANNPIHVADVSDKILKEKLEELGISQENELDGRRVK